MNQVGIVSVVIVTYYTGSALWRAIESVIEQENLHEIIIINNGNPSSVNEKLKILKEQYSQIKLLHPGNIGFAKACNLGVKNSSGEYIVILNPDCVMKTKEDFKRLISFFKIKNDATLVGCKILNSDQSVQRTCIRNQLNLKILFTEGLLLHKIPILKNYLPRINIEAKDLLYPRLVDAISGAFMMIKKTDYINYEGMDEGYFLHCEDIDFCKRIKDEGGNIYYVPDVETVHYLSTSKVSSNIVEWHKLKGFLRYFTEFYNIYTAILLSPLLAIRYVLKYVKNLIFKFHPKNLLNILLKNDSDVENKLFGFDNNPSKPSTKPNIILAGAINQIGIVVLKNLLNENHKINILYRNSSVNFHSENMKWIQMDFRKKTNIINLNSEVLIYTAAIWLLPSLLNSLSNTKIKRLICFSSTSIFTKTKFENKKDKNIVKALKLAEKEVISICKRRNIAYTILRPTMIYGLGQDKNVNLLSNFIKMFKFFPLFNENKGLRQPVHVFDLGDSAIKIIENEKTFYKCYNIGGGENISYREMLARLFKHNNIKIRFLNFSFLSSILKHFDQITSSNFSEIIKRMDQDMIFDNKKAEVDFEYYPRKFLR